MKLVDWSIVLVREEMKVSLEDHGVKGLCRVFFVFRPYRTNTAVTVIDSTHTNSNVYLGFSIRVVR